MTAYPAPVADIWSSDGRRLRTALDRLDAARAALLATGYFRADEVGPDIAPRITEMWSATPSPLAIARTVDTLHELIANLDGDRYNFAPRHVRADLTYLLSLLVGDES